MSSIGVTSIDTLPSSNNANYLNFMNSNIIDFKNNLSVIILCGGKGERLRPLTKNTPKPLIKIGSRTILEYIIEYLINKYRYSDYLELGCDQDQWFSKIKIQAESAGRQLSF